MSSPAEKTTSGGGMSMNTVTTVMAFSVSAFFVLFIFVRLLCARIHLRAGHSAAAAAAAHGDAFPAFSVERGIRGLEPAVVTSFPTAKFGDGSRPRAAALQESQCPVCLEEYEAKDVVRVLPSCGHAFHVACIDAWLRQHSTCPVCRASLRSAAYAKHRPAAAMLPPPVHCPPAAATPMRAAFRQQHQQQQLSTASSSSDADAFQPAAADRLEIVVSDEPVPSAAAGQAEHPHPHPHPATAAAIDR